MRPVLLLFLSLVGCGGDQAVGSYNTAPNVVILQPANQSQFDEGVLVTFEASVSDGQDREDELAVSWISSVDGELAGATPPDATGGVSFSTASLSGGYNHAITLRVVDSGALDGSAEVAITINDRPDAPTLTIVHPVSGEYGEQGEVFEFKVQVGDAQDEPGLLLVGFSSDLDDEFCAPTTDALGVAACEAELSPGDHRLAFSVTDTDSLTTVVEAVFVVLGLDEIDHDGDGYTERDGDCNDSDASVNPAATEYWNDRDDDCDGVVDDNTANYDDDADGQSEVAGDCDDADPSTYEGATESCDGKDNDCDHVIDEDTPCVDDDGDGWTEIDGDCDDSTTVTYPGAAEIEDGADNDCDGIVDEGTRAYDDDFDGYTENGGDCDDDDPSAYPTATETCDGDDDDCDGSADEANAMGCMTYYYDYDGDGYGSTTSQCLCGASGYYTSAYDTDCYDYNSSASPVATSYHSTARGDGSYDYNCDGSTSYYYPSTGTCDWYFFSCTWSYGWESSVPSCGSRSDYIVDCDLGGFPYTECENSTSTYTQSCR